MPLDEALRRRTLTACYKELGVEVTSIPRRLWCARAQDGSLVVTLWEDSFSDSALTRYSIVGRADLPGWVCRWENERRRDELRAVGVGGEFASIVVRAKNTEVRPRQTTQRFVGPKMILTMLDLETGEFKAVRNDQNPADRTRCRP